MAKAKYDEYIESGNWNIAESYSNSEIYRLIHEINEYIKIALFGTSELIDEFIVNEEVKEVARIRALYRIHTNLSLLYENTVFAVKRNDKDLMHTFFDILNKIEKLLPLCEKEIIIQNNNGNKRLKKINPKFFDSVLKSLRTISTQMKYPLNRADLIFRSFDEYDPVKIKEEMLRELEEEG